MRTAGICTSSRFGSQRGATLLIVIGIAAALAVMAATLILVVGNMMANTADSRMREKAATVGEAAMDGQLYALALAWPKTATPSPAPTLDATLLRSQFPTDEFPNTSGDFVDAVYYDDADTNGDGKIDVNDAHWDSNGNRLMYVEAQGRVGDRKTRFQAQVERTFVDTTFPHGIVLYTGGPMWTNAGDKDKVSVHFSDGWEVTGYVGGGCDNPEVFASGVSLKEGADVPPLSSLLPDATVQQIIAMSQGIPGGSNSGTQYYDCTSTNPNGPDDIPTNAEMQGVCVIRVPDFTEVDLTGGINMADGPKAEPQKSDEPGIMLVLGPEPVAPGTNTGAHIKIYQGGNDKFYGVFITDGYLDKAAGTPGFFGMTIFKSEMDMRGTSDIKYDDSAISKLTDKWTLSVRLVPNTWREIQPD